MRAERQTWQFLSRIMEKTLHLLAKYRHMKLAKLQLMNYAAME